MRIRDVLLRAREDVTAAFGQFATFDLRWSYLAVVTMVAVGVVVNLLLPHGWTVWPFVLAAGIMFMVNEAADRNGQGIPPFHIYLLVGCSVVLWLMATLVISQLNPLVLIVGLTVVGYYTFKGYMQIRERAKLIAQRRMQGQCIHCGAVADPQFAFCQNCGEDPDPDASTLKRVGSAPRSTQAKARARATLKPESHTASASRKEQALINRRRTGRGPRR